MPEVVALAKLTRPRLEGVCLRPRLFHRLDEALRRSAVWVEGPPGSGKTTLVASYLERRKARTIWYRVDEADADVATFFHYLGAAARRVTRGRAPWPRFQPDVALDLAAFARHWFRALYASLGESFTLALDDYQEASPRSPLHAIVRTALAELPPAARAIVMSRSGPPAALARLRADGSLARIAPEELQLTAAESRAMVRARRRSASRGADALHARAGGWAAGLTLLLAAEAGDDVAVARGRGTRDVFQYFAGEVLERADPVTQRVLLETALLPEVSAATARLVTGLPRADAILADLAQRGYFTTRHGTGAVYTYHPLFREFLADRARELLAPQRLDEVRSHAARLAAACGAVGDAAALLRDSGAHEELARLLVEKAGQLLDEGRAEVLSRLIREVPAAIRDRDPWLSYWLGASLACLDHAQARPALERAHGLFVERGEADGAYLACAALLETFASEWTDFRPLGRWIGAFGELRRRWPDFPSAEIEARAACGIFAALASARPDDPELPAWERRVAALSAHAPDAGLRAHASFALAHFALWRGDVAEAREALGARPRQGRGGDPFAELGWLVQSARGAATSGDGERALELADEALALARATGNHWWDPGSYLVGVWGATLLGDARRAEAYLSGFERAFDPTMDTIFEQARALAQVRSGERAAARDRLARSLALDEERGALHPASWDHAALAALAHAQGDEDACTRHLARAEELGALTRSHLLKYWTLLLRAARAQAGDRAAAAVLAAEALRLSREKGPFDEMWVARDNLARACALAITHGLEVEEARAVVARRRLQLPPGEVCDAWPHPVEVRMLGSFTLECAGEATDVASRMRTRPVQLLQALVALGAREVPEHELADALFPEAEADMAQHALEMNLSRLRKLLGTKQAILQCERRLSIDEGTCWVDALALDGWLTCARPPSDPDEAKRAAERVLGLYRGPFLGATESAWARPMRDRLRRRLGPFANALASALMRAARDDEAQAFQRELRRRDPQLSPAVTSARDGVA